MQASFYSNGKLLITGEYTVLDGAKALALPTKYGQRLLIEKGENQLIEWASQDSDGSIWFESRFTFDSVIQKENFENDAIKTTLIAILHHAYSLNPDFLTASTGYKVTTQLTFPRQWGLGTSSTLINNIAQWTAVDAFELLHNSFGGSGYDIACAQHDCPITYQLSDKTPLATPVTFLPDFKENIYFVYLNQKQNSRSAIANYREKRHDIASIITQINTYTQNILEAKTLEEFSNILTAHESLMSRVLETPTVQSYLFADFEGTIKSLGAWGGDFVMVVSKENPSAYFQAKGYDIILRYEEMIL
ncbi:GYDIA family GHMP kinase [Flavobacterium sp.]|uniref:GYDIA family GHMP kinase n=1 Tax=Flavobacterium sp. TaxID=239 RepID=UPI003D149770